MAENVSGMPSENTGNTSEATRSGFLEGARTTRTLMVAGAVLATGMCLLGNENSGSDKDNGNRNRDNSSCSPNEELRARGAALRGLNADGFGIRRIPPFAPSSECDANGEAYSNDKLTVKLGSTGCRSRLRVRLVGDNTSVAVKTFQGIPFRYNRKEAHGIGFASASDVLSAAKFGRYPATPAMQKAYTRCI